MITAQNRNLPTCCGPTDEEAVVGVGASGRQAVVDDVVDGELVNVATGLPGTGVTDGVTDGESDFASAFASSANKSSTSSTTEGDFFCEGMNSFSKRAALL